MSTIDNGELAKRLEELNVLVNPDVLMAHHAIIDDDPSSELILVMYQNLPTILSALRGQEGMVLVPREPTRDLKMALCEGLRHDGFEVVFDSDKAYRAMIAAAPQEAGR